MNLSSSTLRLVGIAAFSSMAATRICDPMLVPLSQEFGIRTGDAAAVVSAYAIAYGLLQLFYGPLGDRLGKVKVVVGGALACGVLSALTAAAPNFGLLVLARTAMGAAAAGIIPLSMAWIGDQVPYEQRQETLARLLGATVSGMMVGQWFGGFAADVLHWRWAFVVLALLFLTAGTLLWRETARLPKVPAPASGQASLSLGQQALKTLQLLRLPRVRWVLAVTGLEGALAFGPLAFAPSQLVERFGLSVSTAASVMVLYGIGGLLYSQFARRWLGLLGEKGLARLGGSLIATGLLGFAWGTQAWHGVLGSLVAGLGFYMLHNTLQTQATQMAPEARGTAVTLFAGILFLGQSLGVTAVATGGRWLSTSLLFTGAALGVLALCLVVATRVQGRAAA